MVVDVIRWLFIYQGVPKSQLGLLDVLVDDSQKLEDLCVEPFMGQVADSVRVLKCMQILDGFGELALDERRQVIIEAKTAGNVTLV